VRLLGQHRSPVHSARFGGRCGGGRSRLVLERSLDRNTLALPLKEDNAALHHGQSMDGVCSRDGGRSCGTHGEAVKDAFAGESRTHAVATLGSLHVGGLLA
jgi:hypothetical protein